MRPEIFYGNSSVKITLPRTMRLLGVLRNKRVIRGKTSILFDKAMDNPVSGAGIERVAEAGGRILIVVPDATRSAHLSEILPRLMKRLNRPKSDVDIIVATGSHKAHDRRQLTGLLGSSIVANHDIINHSVKDECLSDFGMAAGGVPVKLNSALKNYGLIVSVGVIEPHLYAGYSGGAKTVAIGLAGMDTINATHSVRFFKNPMTKIGSIAGNPFQSMLWKIAGKVNIGFCINIVNSPEGFPAMFFCGSPEDAFGEGVKFAGNICEVSAPRQADIVICGTGYPKDVNLYQASRAINYIAGVDRPILKKGGLLIVAARLKDGFGSSPAELMFQDRLRKMGDPAEFVKDIEAFGCVAGEHRAYMVAMALKDYRVILVTKGVRGALPFPAFADMGKALSYAAGISGNKASVYIIPKALSVIARFAG